MHELAGVSVDECLEPDAGVVILDLDDMGEGEGAVLLGDKLEGRGPLVELAVERSLSLRDGILERHGGRRRRDGLC